ncbi:MAG: adenylate/guanylate cyclase domain-containing protein [Turneriella sp.]
MKGVEQALRMAGQLTSLRKMAEKHRFTATIPFSFPVAEVWPYLIRNNLVSREAKKPVTQFAAEEMHGGWKLTATSFRKFGIPVEAWELPWEWVENQWVRFEALSISGPVKYFCFYFHLFPSDRGCDLLFEVRYVPRFPILGRVLLSGTFRDYCRVYKSLENRIPRKAQYAPALFFESSAEKSREAESLAAEYLKLGADEATAKTLAAFVTLAPDVMLQKIRPKEIAAESGTNFLDTTAFMLAATRAGLFDMHWEILCPACRAPNADARNLSLLKGESHCEFCDISYDADFDRNVEVSFSPHGSVRKIDPVMYCRGNPGQTPHIHSQLTILAGQKEVILGGLPAGLYNFRRGERTKIAGISVEKGRHASNRFALSHPPDGLNFAADKDIVIHNDTAQVETVRIEHPSYNDLALTAFEVSTIQTFRDLFSAEILRPDLKLAIRNAVFFFSDLKDSTQLYEERGDAEAFALVQSHFDIMIRIIAANHGAVVKTIGDAVMAVFTRSSDALAAALAIHSDIADFNRTSPEHKLVVKIGLHEGPALALTLNDKLDYFGSTVNKAARIQNEAGGNETVISEDLYRRLMNEARFASLKVEPYTAQLKGIKSEMVLYRITAA